MHIPQNSQGLCSISQEHVLSCGWAVTTLNSSELNMLTVEAEVQASFYLFLCLFATASPIWRNYIIKITGLLTIPPALFSYLSHSWTRPTVLFQQKINSVNSIWHKRIKPLMGILLAIFYTCIMLERITKAVNIWPLLCLMGLTASKRKHILSKKQLHRLRYYKISLNIYQLANLFE